MLTPPGHSAAHCGSPAPGAGPGQVYGAEQALRSEPAGVRRHAALFLTGPTGVSVGGAVSEGGCGHRVEAGPRAWRAQLRAWHLHDEAAVRTRTRHPRPCTSGICRGRRVQRPNVAPPGPSLSSSTNTGLCASVKSWFEPGSACSCLNCPSLSLLVCKTRSPTASRVPRMGDVDPKCRASSLASQSRGRGPAPGRP